MITLCPTSYEIAQKKSNFSSWVRKKLLEDNEKRDPLGWTYEYKCPLCQCLRIFPNQEMEWRCNKCNIPMKFTEVIE